LSEGIRTIAGSYYSPRAGSVEDALEAIAFRTSGLTLSGTLLRVNGDHVCLRREPARVSEPVKHGTLWDERWMIMGPAPSDAKVATLGEKGIAQVSGWRDTGHDREVLLATPAIWLKDELISAPIADQSANNSAEWRIRNPFFTQRPYHH